MEKPRVVECQGKPNILLHKKEIRRLIGLTKQKGLTLIPLRVYNARNLVKLEFGLCRGKKKYEKREKIKKRDFDREKERAIKRTT